MSHDQKIGGHLLIAVSAAIVVVMASCQYALLSSMLEGSRFGKGGSGELAAGPAMWFTRWNLGQWASYQNLIQVLAIVAFLLGAIRIAKRANENRPSLKQW